MISILHALALPAVLFVALMILKQFSDLRFCVICASFSLTWVLLGLLYIAGLFDSLILVALMAGMTIHGIYEISEKKVKERFLVFRLPALLSVLGSFYFVFTWSFRFEAKLLIAATWIPFLILFLYRDNGKFSSWADEVIQCCRDW